MTDSSEDRLASVAPLRRPQGRRRMSLAQWPITLVLLGVGIALVMIGTDHFRRGSIVLSASVMLAMFLRLLLPSSGIGMLAVRSRKTDVVVLGVLAVGLTIFTFWVPAPT